VLRKRDGPLFRDRVPRWVAAPSAPLSVAELLAIHDAAIAATARLVMESHLLIGSDCALARQWREAVLKSREALARTVPRGDVTRPPRD
jgi:hypothetical protein